MGEFGENVRDIWEGVVGFLALGCRDLGNRIGILVRSMALRRQDKAAAAQQLSLGRKAWNLHVLSIDAYPVVDKIDSIERSVMVKRESCEEIEQKAEDLRSQRKKHVAHYQKELTEQLRLRKPVDEEHHGQLVEVKRLQRELATTRNEIAEHGKKLELQGKRLAEVRDGDEERSSDYVRSEVEHEIEFIERSLQLKRERIDFLSLRLEEKTQSAERSGKVLAQFDALIADLRSRQREGAAKIDEALTKLDVSRRQIEREIRRLRREMTPLFGELGMELRRRRHEDPELAKEYAEIARIEKESENLAKEIAKLRSDSASIGPGVKIGFYGLIVLIVALVTWICFLIF